MPLLIRDIPTISGIEPGLFIGDLGSSSDISTLTDNNITAMVSLANAKSEKWSRPANRKLVPEDCHMFVCCADSPTQDLLVQLADICDFIDKHTAKPDLDSMLQTSSGQDSTGAFQGDPSTFIPRNVLVHCTAGVSRSATIVVAYLMRKRHQKLDVILKSVMEKRRIEPSRNFMDQLRIWEEVNYEIWEDPERTRPKEPYKDFLERREARLRAEHRHTSSSSSST